MPVIGFIAVILISFVIGAVFYFVFERRGPWGSFWTFFIVLFLGVFMAYVWVRPAGPVYWGVAIFPLLFVGLLFALLLAAATPPVRNRKLRKRDGPVVPEQELEEITPEDDRTALGIFFWTALILFIALLLAGIYY